MMETCTVRVALQFNNEQTPSLEIITGKKCKRSPFSVRQLDSFLIRFSIPVFHIIPPVFVNFVSVISFSVNQDLFILILFLHHIQSIHVTFCLIGLQCIE